MKNYAALLLDPLWQRKRLEILQRDNFSCRTCGSQERTLHVHHRYYIKDRVPWAYPKWALITLCDVCHKTAREFDRIAHEEWEFAIDTFVAIDPEFLDRLFRACDAIHSAQRFAAAEGISPPTFTPKDLAEQLFLTCPLE